ncbi:uncharacterized protein A1O9_00265 [Exophiala aquamarina CBS 119918]|uniref:Uncharacterized protein n=1 Tax=Exophiala aquamarina CBS 119918 TaxID=1182545 RepID=A0A072PSK3_9EURO|nr:uncharacterized protein A1O9_00265 [Exophiala aquamarina CBS 119918]KEF62293.1 hypothetical protein A1O9_00265 [Exophiala aquamarina CBS 119918]
MDLPQNPAGQPPAEPPRQGNPDVRKYDGKLICYGCEEPKLKGFCDGSMKIFPGDTCHWHRIFLDQSLTPARQLQRTPVNLQPKVSKTSVFHTGNCIDPTDYFIVGEENLWTSIYFRRCHGAYQNSLRQEMPSTKEHVILKVESIPQSIDLKPLWQRMEAIWSSSEDRKRLWAGERLIARGG